MCLYLIDKRTLFVYRCVLVSLCVCVTFAWYFPVFSVYVCIEPLFCGLRYITVHFSWLENDNRDCDKKRYIYITKKKAKKIEEWPCTIYGAVCTWKFIYCYNFICSCIRTFCNEAWIYFTFLLQASFQYFSTTSD